MATEGRPSKNRSKEIDDEIRFYYERGIDEMEVVNRTKHTWRTVNARYEKWDKLLSDRTDKVFLEKQDHAKARALNALDKQIVELLSIQQVAIKDVARLENPTYEQIKGDVRKALAWMIFDLTDRKAALAMTPTVAARVKQEVKELIDKYQKRELTEQTVSNSK